MEQKKASGNPFFATSFAQVLIERKHFFLNSQSEYDVQYQGLDPLGRVDDQLPSTIEKLILARFDILEGQQQLILQVGKVKDVCLFIEYFQGCISDWLSLYNFTSLGFDS